MKYANKNICIIIPALNEEESIPKVIQSLPKEEFRLNVIVCDNGSTDHTAQVSKRLGARVVYEKEKGYGRACLKALENVPDTTDIITFIDADYSDHPEELTKILEPILRNKADMVIGSRTIRRDSRKALLPQALLGNYIAVFLIRLFWGYRFTDLGPFRAILKEKLDILNMQDKNFGWTVEMQIKAAKKKLRVEEVPVSYRKRIGKSKISGTLKGSFMAGVIILKTIFKEWIK